MPAIHGCQAGGTGERRMGYGFRQLGDLIVDELDVVDLAGDKRQVGIADVLAQAFDQGLQLRQVVGVIGIRLSLMPEDALEGARFPRDPNSFD